MRVITTSEEIARFVAINLAAAINQYEPLNHMTVDDLIGLKNAIKADVENGFKKTNETFEIAVKALFEIKKYN